MRIFITDVNGYLGWSLPQHLAGHGHDVCGADLFLRHRRV